MMRRPYRAAEGSGARKGEAGWRPVARFWLLLLLPASVNLAVFFVGLFVALAATYPEHHRALFATAFGGWAVLTVLLSHSFLRQSGLSASPWRVLPHGMAAGAVLVVLLATAWMGEA